jgi:hypothetical protein
VTTPAIIMTTFTASNGWLYSLACVRTRFEDEGQVIVEATDETGALQLVEQGGWSKRRTDDGPCVLRVEMLPGRSDATALMMMVSYLVDVGGSFGIEATELS